MIKSRKELLIEAEEELSNIKKSIKNESPWPIESEEPWYKKLKISDSDYKDLIKYKIKESEIKERVKLLAYIDSNNKSYVPGLIVKKQSKLYNSIISIIDHLKDDKKNKWLYNWVISTFNTPSLIMIMRYTMDHLMVAEYVVKNKKLPQKNSSREYLINTLAMRMLDEKRYPSSTWSEFFAKLIRAGLMGR